MVRLAKTDISRSKNHDDHCNACGACNLCDRCSHCGNCRNCGKPVVLQPVVIPRPYPVYPTPHPWVRPNTGPTWSVNTQRWGLQVDGTYGGQITGHINC